MADTLKARIGALRPNTIGSGEGYADAVDDVITLLDEWCKSPLVITDVQSAIVHSDGYPRDPRQMAVDVLSTLTGDNTKWEGK